MHALLLLVLRTTDDSQYILLIKSVGFMNTDVETSFLLFIIPWVAILNITHTGRVSDHAIIGHRRNSDASPGETEDAIDVDLAPVYAPSRTLL